MQKDNNTLTSGNICLSNTERFRKENYSESLTALTLSWADPENLEALLDFIAPAVHVPRRFEFRQLGTADYFLTEVDDIRATGASFKRVEYYGSPTTQKTLNKGLTIRMDHDEVAGDDWQERVVELLMKRLYRNELRRVLSALDSVAESKDVAWDEHTLPDASVRAGLIAASEAAGLRPNRLIFSQGAWDARAEAYEKLTTLPGAYAASTLSEQALADRLSVDGLRIVRSRYEGADKLEDTVGKAVYGYYADNYILKDEPSHLKRFVTPMDGGDGFRVYVETHAKYTDISVEHYSNVVVTCDKGLIKFKLNN